MNKTKKTRMILVILMIFVVVTLFFFFRKEDTNTLKQAKQIDAIPKYGYVLYENKNKLYQEYFKKLKEELVEEQINEENYATLISELFTMDFYTLDNKVTNTDVGGIIFIHPKAKDTFLLTAENTLYKYIESNVYGNRNQKLPIVEKTEIEKIEHKSFTSDEVNDENSYEITVKLTYKENLGYPSHVILTIVHEEEKLYITEVK